MSIVNLDSMLKPASVALIGASDREGSLGRVVMRNLLAAGFAGSIHPVNPKGGTVADRPAFARVQDIPTAPDLAVICTPAPTVPGLIGELGAAGTRAAVVLSAGMRAEGDDGRSLTEAMLEQADHHGVRILGPNCVGLMIPGLGLNASFAHAEPLPGRIAMISQSGALCTTLIDWARSRNIGFSHFISIGDTADVDFGDLINWLGDQGNVDVILLYIESIGDARKFLSAARATSRRKPIVAIKAGRVSEGARAAASHTGALTGGDAVFDAAIRRAGMLRVFGIDALFNAVTTLPRARRIHGDRLLIVTNGGGPGVLATDELILAGGHLAELPQQTVAALDECLPAGWSRANPVDIIGDADERRYARAIETALSGGGFDAALVMLVPTATVDNSRVADTVIELAKKAHKPVLVNWMGEAAVREARAHFDLAGLASFETPEDAIEGFMQLVDYHRNQASLLETPAELPEVLSPDRAAVQTIVQRVRAEGRRMLSEPEAKDVLAAYEIPVVQARIAADADSAAAIAGEIGYPVAVKILSRDISHKSDVGGVVLDIEDETSLRAVIRRIGKQVAELRPDALIDGFTVQQMARRPGAYELILGMSTDPVFGAALTFGQGGTAVEVVKDVAVALPPLNMALARELVARTRIAAQLRGYRDRAAVNLDVLYLALIRLSQLVVDFPDILEVDINPLLADSDGVIALDARVVISPEPVPAYRHLAIRPYPNALERRARLKDGEELIVRPIRPEDETRHGEFLARVDPEDLRLRFFRNVNRFTHEQLASFAQIDYDREMAIVAIRERADGRTECLGVARAITDANNHHAEFAVLVRSDVKRRGLASMLMRAIIDYQRERGTHELVGLVLPDNSAMLSFMRSLGFQVHLDPVERVMRCTMALNPAD